MSTELSTDQGDRIRTAFESMKDFGTEGVIVFTRESVEIIGQDRAKLVDVRFSILSSKIRETGGDYGYAGGEPFIRLGIRTKAVSSALKRFSQGDIVAIGANIGNTYELHVSCRSEGRKFVCKLVAPDPLEDLPPTSALRSIKYKGSITMSSTVFHSIIGDLSTSDAEMIEIRCDGRDLKFSAKGLFSKTSVTIQDANVIQGLSDNNGQQDSWDVCESFSTIHLQRIAKAKNIAPRIIVSIGSNLPAMFEYETPIGLLTYLVCPRDKNVFCNSPIGSVQGQKRPREFCGNESDDF
jgi:hypothetical protein